ncbi:hypothetical protein ACOSQ4_001004 [Xanthoceras sorbifolium]
MRQKFGAHDTSLQLMNKRQEDIKASLDGDLKSLSDQVRKNIYQDQFKKISLMLSTLPEQIEASLMKLQIELCNIFAKEMQAMSCSLRSPNRNGQVANAKKTLYKPSFIFNLSWPFTCENLQRTGRCSTRQKKPQSVKGPTVPPKLCVQSIEVPKVELGGSVKKERATFKRRIPDKKHKQKGVSSVGQTMKSS